MTITERARAAILALWEEYRPEEKIAQETLTCILAMVCLEVERNVRGKMIDEDYERIMQSVQGYSKV